MSDPSPLNDADTDRLPIPWYRRPAFGVVLIALFLCSAVVVLVVKNYGAWAGAPGMIPGDTREIPARVSQLELMDDQFDMSGLTIERDTIHDGGPGLDAIPSITTVAARPDPDPFKGHKDRRGAGPPEVVHVSQAAFLKDDSRIVAVTIHGASRAYPIGVLNWHECINDVLGGVPIAVVYCPLCDSVTVIDRRVGEGDDAITLEFGISGLLHNSNVLLYDRQERGLWSQVMLEAVSGPRAGTAVRHLGGWAIAPFKRWRDTHPNGEVLSFKTGYERAYGRDPYAGFAHSDELMFPVAQQDDRLPLKQRVLGVMHGEERIAFVLSGRARSIGHAFADGKRLVLIEDGSGGVEIIQQPKGTKAVHTYWYAWAAFHPETELVE